MRYHPMILLGLALGLALSAQTFPGPAPSGGGPRMVYDSSREVTLTGTVTGVTTSTRGPGPFVTLAFLAADKTYEVIAGPEFLLKQNQVTFAKDD